MPNNPLVDAFRYLFTGSPEQGPGLFSPQNIGNAMGQTGQDIKTIMAPTQRMPTVDVTATRIPQSVPSVPPIDVGALRQQFVQNMGAQQMAGTRQPKDEKQGGGISWQMLMDIGIPALSAIVGTAAPGTLAGAAGLSTGYTGAREKQREAETKQKNLKELMGIKSGIKKTPSKESLLKMAQNEAFRQMGGSAFGGMALQNPEKKSKYESLVKSLYDSYVSQFIGQDNMETTVEDIDTSDDLIDQEWEKYQSGNL